MGAPVRNCIELNAVGELHLVALLKPTPFLVPLGFPAFFSGELVGSGGYDLVIVELVRFVGGGRVG